MKESNEGYNETHKEGNNIKRKSKKSYINNKKKKSKNY